MENRQFKIVGKHFSEFYLLNVKKLWNAFSNVFQYGIIRKRDRLPRKLEKRRIPQGILFFVKEAGVSPAFEEADAKKKKQEWSYDSGGKN